MSNYSRERRGYRLEVFAFDGRYTAMLTNLTSGATLRTDGWSHYDTALQDVQEMYASGLI
jgi:hypothetical protein